MQTFAPRALLFLAIGLALAALTGRVSRHFPHSHEEAVTIERVEAVLRNAHAIQALSVGSSHARAIDFDVLALNGQELGLPWNDLREVEHQIRTLAPRLPNLEVVFIGISYFSFHWDNDQGGDDYYLASRRLFYTLSPSWRWMPGDAHNFARGKTYWLARPDNWATVLRSVGGRDPHAEARVRHHLDREQENSDSTLLAHARLRVPRTLATQAQMLAADPRIVRRNYDALAATIGYLQQRGVRVVLFTPPYYRHYRVLYQGEPALEEMERLAARLSREHGVPWLDLSAHPLSHDPTLFRDSDHLNPRGKLRFTRILQQHLHSASAARPDEQ